MLVFNVCHFDAAQAFVQSELNETMFIHLPPGCGYLSGKVVFLARSLYGFEQASRTGHYDLVRGMHCLCFQQSAGMYV